MSKKGSKSKHLMGLGGSSITNKKLSDKSSSYFQKGPKLNLRKMNLYLQNYEAKKGAKSSSKHKIL